MASNGCRYSYFVNDECLYELSLRTTKELGDRVIIGDDYLKLLPKNGELIEYKVHDVIDTGMQRRYLISFIEKYQLVILYTQFWEATKVEIISMRDGSKNEIINGVPIFSPDMNRFASFYYDGELGDAPPQIGIYSLHIDSSKQTHIENEYIFDSRGMITHLEWIGNNKLNYHECYSFDAKKPNLKDNIVEDKVCHRHLNSYAVKGTLTLVNQKWANVKQ